MRSRHRSQALEGVETVQVIALRVEYHVSLVLDHRPNQGLLAIEVVVDLRAAHACRRPDVLQCRLGHAVLEHQSRRSGNDPKTSLLAAPCEPAGTVDRSLTRHDCTIAENWIGQPTFSGRLWIRQPTTSSGRSPYRAD